MAQSFETEIDNVELKPYDIDIMAISEEAPTSIKGDRVESKGNEDNSGRKMDSMLKCWSDASKIASKNISLRKEVYDYYGLDCSKEVDQDIDFEVVEILDLGFTNLKDYHDCCKKQYNDVKMMNLERQGIPPLAHN